MAEETDVQVDGAQVQFKRLTFVLSHYYLLSYLMCVSNVLFVFIIGDVQHVE